MPLRTVVSSWVNSSTVIVVPSGTEPGWMAMTLPISLASTPPDAPIVALDGGLGTTLTETLLVVSPPGPLAMAENSVTPAASTLASTKMR